MKTSDMKSILSKALDKYGKLAAAFGKKDELIEKYAVYETVDFTGKNYRHLRDALSIVGNILKEDLENQTYIATVQTGFKNSATALVVARIENASLSIAAYAKEGIIRQNLAAKAIERIKAEL